MSFRLDRPGTLGGVDTSYFPTMEAAQAEEARLTRSGVKNVIAWEQADDTGPWVAEASVNAVSSPEQPEPGPLTVTTSGNTPDDDPGDVLWSRGFGFSDWLKQAFGMANDQDGMSA